MGADLYLMSAYEPARKKWEPRFEAAVAARDRHEPGTDEHECWQKRVSRYYEKMMSAGYFRDPYNDWDVLWKFGLSWWEDVIPMLDAEACLVPVEATRLITMLDEHDEDFRSALAELSHDDARYFRRQARELRAFLRAAVALNEPVRCSL